MADDTDFKFDDKLRQQIHFDWGKHYKRLNLNETAKKQFLDSLSLKENAHGPMEQLSKCHLVRGDASKALDLANQCVKNYTKITRQKCHRNECIYDGNEFETCLVERYRMYDDKKPVLGSIDAIKMTELTLEESIGNQTGSFLNNFREAISELDKIESETVDTRPLWKIRRDKKECDVVSVCSDSNERDTVDTLDHPLHKYEFRKKQKKNRTLYFSTPTIETYDFLNNLSNDPRLNFPPSEESTNVIKTAVEEELNVFKKFEEMLHQRQPIYAKKLLRSKNNEKFNKVSLLRTIETIERRAENQLERINELKDSNNVSGLITYVEDIMTNFYLIKSVNVFPKKVEFIEAIYNIIGTCYVDMIQTNCWHDTYLRLDSALNHHHGFVVPKTFNISPVSNNSAEHFLKRLQYANIPIEKCYIYHQLSRVYFEQEKFVESKEMGEELVNIARSLNNHTWMLLGHLRVIMINAVLGDYDNVKVNVEAIREWKANVKVSVWNFLEETIRLMEYP